MNTKNIICFGFGQVAKNFIKKLKDQGATFKLTTTSREDSKTKEFENIIMKVFNLQRKVLIKTLYQDLRKQIIFYYL